MSTTETTTDQTDAEPTGAATYSPEDNKLRLYIGRVPRPEYEKLRAEGWKALYKQRDAGGGDFVATWTPSRRDTALKYSGGFIADEDMGPAERAADRAERFSGYRDKRTDEATGHADRFDSGPQAHGYQSEKRAERAAARHDRIADKAGDAWGRAEYWQRRTAGVISHALHVAVPGVRVGRIKVIEAEMRREEKQRAELVERWRKWEQIAAMTDPAKQTKFAEIMAGGCTGWATYKHPRTGRDGSLYDFVREEAADRITGAECAALYFKNRTSPDSPEWEQTRLSDWINHYKLRLAYENQMIEAQGGRAAFVEMEIGGWIGERQIRKVNKSNATGRAVSVTLKCKGSRYDSNAPGWCLIAYNIERLPADAYTPPTAEDLAALESEKAEEKAAAPKVEPCPLVNPTDADAEKLQDIWNKAERSKYATPQTVLRMTFAQYTGRGTAKIMCENGTEHRTRYGKNLTRCDVFKVRRMHGDNYSADRVVILTDKPQKALPWASLEKAKAKQPTRETLAPRMAELRALMIELQGYRPQTPAEMSLLSDAEYCGLVSLECSRPQWTEAGATLMHQASKA